MSDFVFEAGTWIIAIGCVLSVLLYAMRIAYRCGADDGYRVGYKAGVRFGRLKLLEHKQNDGYGSYN
jgi:hypothetical protein